MGSHVVPTVTLDNCDKEPIHIPGAIQPHGALLALDLQGRILACSDNFETITGVALSAGDGVHEALFGATLMELLDEALSAVGPWTNSVEAHLGETLFDVIGHTHDSVCYLEFEPRTSGIASFTQFAMYAQRIISRVQLRDDVDVLLDSVTNEIRRMTGYDRVMAYRFRPDLSGEVVSEARRDDLESFLGQRYPASDIPAQARRLYIQNPIRLIADVGYVGSRLVPSLNPLTGHPFDLSHSTLRSVSPIHCEYLSNMGVQASMSVSIVVGGKLWGLFACHHMSPKTLPHPVRMSFQVCSHVCSAMVERLEANRESELSHQSTERRAALMRQVRESEDLLSALADPGLNVAGLMACDGAAVMMGGRVQSIGGDFASLAALVAARLGDREEDEFVTDRWQHDDASGDDSRYCGVVAIRFHRADAGWIFWFRLEEVHKIRWGGKPDKSMSVGPSGPRLTPRGSFDAWEEVVRGTSAPWSAGDLAMAGRLRTDMVELCLNRAGEIDRMRQRLIATLGHDLRTPLQSISMAASLLSNDSGRTGELREHINYSSSRMERLISQILEMSRLQAGSGIAVYPVATNVSELLQGVLQETSVAYPGYPMEVDIEPSVRATIDPDRYAQVAVNLLSNARHHKKLGSSVQIELTQRAQDVVLRISNQAETLSPQQLSTLFVPFKQQNSSPERNRTGLGIGLYISSAIADAHRGRLEVAQDQGLITFSLILPLQAA
ncbi:GAF domain-containing protein [Halopseudomonas nanhaiensis]|uniref:GAF domain-containing protein n=1 Tax=Halopseudomonas nanhaiensis TaxID=2830842 RepID=UPI001CC0A346|nr:GAF domain-containing protein [Halopseudomonas nanhaiensis]UAW99367.1 GAF domain-containing protein [Halopseudomonas nanhaiensis]